MRTVDTERVPAFCRYLFCWPFSTSWVSSVEGLVCCWVEDGSCVHCCVFSVSWMAAASSKSAEHVDDLTASLWSAVSAVHLTISTERRGHDWRFAMFTDWCTVECWVTNKTVVLWCFSLPSLLLQHLSTITLNTTDIKLLRDLAVCVCCIWQCICCCRNYALNIYCGTKEEQTDQEHNSTWCCFSIHISVTEEGLDNVAEVSKHIDHQ